MLRQQLLIRVQHAAGRDEPLARLLERLIPLAVDVVADHEVADPNPLRCYLRCLSNIPAGVTHVCVLQDDSLPCASFGRQVAEAVGERPDDVISLFVGGLSNRTRKDYYGAMNRREHWCPIYFRDIHHVVALVWPVALAADFVGWVPTARFPGRHPPRSDDQAVGFWARTSRPRRTVWATVPCLVEHPDDVPSVAQRARGGDGQDKGRRAIWFQE